MNFGHIITYVTPESDILACLFTHTRLLKCHTMLLEAYNRLLEAHKRYDSGGGDLLVWGIKFSRGIWISKKEKPFSGIGKYQFSKILSCGRPFHFTYF